MDWQPRIFLRGEMLNLSVYFLIRVINRSTHVAIVAINPVVSTPVTPTIVTAIITWVTFFMPFTHVTIE